MSVELLAPAGNMECLKSAVLNGADAVYLAGNNFGARSYADNFNNEEMEEAVDFCHLRGKAVYVTVNTLVTDREIEELLGYLGFLYEIGVDGVIVQDLGVADIVLKHFPEMSVHGSTQMTIHNLEGALYLQRLGFKRVVLSRELSFDEIKYIKENSEIELEIFIHGALCMSYSGQCLMSSFFGGRSGNRGKCAQPCRLLYSGELEVEKKNLLSLKDLCGVDYVQALSDIGVASLKIEGRMKGTDYVSTVTGVYRRIIDEKSVSKKDRVLLDTVFNRGGQTNGYLEGKKGIEMFCFHKPENPYVLNNYEMEEPTETKHKFSAFLSLKNGKRALIRLKNLSENVEEIEFMSDFVCCEAEKNPLTKEDVIAQISKTGGTFAEITDIEIELDDNIFLPKKVLNELRREALNHAEKRLLDSKKRERKTVDSSEIFKEISAVKDDNFEYYVKVNNKKQFDIVKNYNFGKIFVPYSLILSDVDNFSGKENLVVATPGIITREIKDKIVSLMEKGFRKFEISNISLLEILKNCELYGNFRLNIFNSFALLHLKLAESCGKGNKFISCELSPELTLPQIRDIVKLIPVISTVYGYTPLMLTENCILKNADKCKCDGVGYIFDRKGEKLPVIKDMGECRSILLNAKPIFMLDKADEIRRAGISKSMVFFTIEAEKECQMICDFIFSGGKINIDYTRGHFYKGVL